MAADAAATTKPKGHALARSLEFPHFLLIRLVAYALASASRLVSSASRVVSTFEAPA